MVAAGYTALGLAVGLPAAYSIARWRQQRLAVVILVARIVPGIAYLIPWYILFRSAPHRLRAHVRRRQAVAAARARGMR